MRDSQQRLIDRHHVFLPIGTPGDVLEQRAEGLADAFDSSKDLAVLERFDAVLGRLDALSYQLDLIALLDALSALEEGRLKPKTPWTRSKMTPGKFDAMLRGIVGARMVVDRLQGTSKLSQNKADEDRLGAAAGLGGHPIADLMRKA